MGEKDKQRLRSGEPQAPAGPPPQPSGLNAGERLAWSECSQRLAEMGLANKADCFLMEQLARLVAIDRNRKAKLSLTERLRLAKQIVAICDKLGLSQEARIRMAVAGPAKASGKLAKYS